jgi:N6-adenosine-specific RNA methylase IME4
MAAWGFKYQCVMTWHKNTGIVPYSWMYDTEHVLFGSRGGLKVAKRGQRLSFDEPVNGHSVKPAVFYDRVRNASPGPRLDMFPGVEHDGFEPWGLEASHRVD